MSRLSNTKPLLCRELVGREHELQELHEALQRAATGQPQLVLLAGEAGLGKTKLCRTFMQASQAEQAVILFGQAILQDASLPFGPLLDAFRRYFTITTKTPSPPDDSLRTALTFLFQLLPELAALFSEITPAFEPKGAAVQSQQAIFHGILSVLQILARSSPGAVAVGSGRSALGRRNQPGMAGLSCTTPGCQWYICHFDAYREVNGINDFGNVSG